MGFVDWGNRDGRPVMVPAPNVMPSCAIQYVHEGIPSRMISPHVLFGVIYETQSIVGRTITVSMNDRLIATGSIITRAEAETINPVDLRQDLPALDACGSSEGRYRTRSRQWR